MVTWIVTLTLAGTAHAEPPPEEGPRNRRLAVLPVQNYAVAPEELWDDADPLVPPVEAALQRFLLKRLAVEPYLDVIPPEEIVERLNRIRMHREGAMLGLERMRLGLDLYKALRVGEAIPHLEQAHAALTAAFHDVVDPVTMSDLSLHMALCYLEKEPHKTHVALKEMFHRNPTRRFRPGYYSQDFEQALRSAMTDFQATYPKENPLGSTARLDRLAEAIDVDSVIFAFLQPTPSGPEIRIVVHDRHSRGVSFRAGFESTSRAADLERMDRFVSRWTTCLPSQIGAPEAPPKQVSDFVLDTSFTYSVFASLFGDDALTSTPFHNLGLAVAGEWQFLSGLGTFIQLNVLLTTQDSLRDLTNPPPNVRLAAGVSYAYSGESWRIFARFGLDVNFLLGEFDITRDPWCKWLAGHERCLGRIDTYADEYLMGFYVAFGGQIFVSRGMYVTLRVGVSAYVAPGDAVELNFPLTFESGIGYKF